MDGNTYFGDQRPHKGGRLGLANGHLDRSDGHSFDVRLAIDAIATLDFWRSSAGYQVDRL